MTQSHTANDFGTDDSPIPYALRRLPPELVEEDISEAPTSPGVDMLADEETK